MRLISFTESSNTRIGLLQGDHIIDLSQVAPSLPSDMLSFLEEGDGAMLQAAKYTSASGHYSALDVVIEAPLARPPKILAIGLNYRAHAEESNMDIPKHPMVFTKQATSANGPYAPIHSPPETDARLRGRTGRGDWQALPTRQQARCKQSYCRLLRFE